MSVSRKVSKTALNHVLRSMEAVHDVREEIPERRQALELWNGFLVACESGKPWDIVPLLKSVRALLT
jgi:hypothetical protein